jgi:glyoxylase-like metal-dependent hydrolase (beta-lactamase superfamily II)
MKRLLILTTLLAATSSAPAQENEVEFKSFQLSDTVYMLKGAGGNVGISAGDDGLYIIDDQVKPVTAQLLDAIKEISDAPIRFVINTHYHYDHTGGNETLGGQGTVIIAHDNIRSRMNSEQVNIFLGSTTPAYPAPALPVLTFNDQISLHLNVRAQQHITSRMVIPTVTASFIFQSVTLSIWATCTSMACIRL